MRKILVFVPTLNGGGAEKSTVLLANELAISHDVTLITRESGIYKKIIKKSVIHKNFKKNKMIYALPSIILFLLKNRDYDIIISSMHYANKYLLFSKLITMYKSNFIAILRSITSEDNNTSNISKAYTKYLYKHASNIISISKAVESDFKSFYKVQSKYHIIPNPIEVLELQQKNKEEIFTDILTVGRLEKPKNVDKILMFIKLQKRIQNNIKLHIVGSGSQKENLKRIVYENKLSNNVIFTGFTLNLASYYKSTQVFLSFSEHEGLGNTILEALLSGIPAFVKKGSGGAEEIIKKHVNNSDDFIFQDEYDLCEKYNEFLKHKEFNLKSSINEYTSSNIANKYKEVF